MVDLVVHFMEHPYAEDERTGELMRLKFFDAGTVHMDKLSTVWATPLLLVSTNLLRTRHSLVELSTVWATPLEH